MPKELTKKLKSDVLRQVGALPVRVRNGQVEVCLVTTRETGRWTIPKGWPMKGRHDHIAARIEAEQEAGITGRPRRKAIGSFNYWKRFLTHFALVEVSVYRLDVTDRLKTWKEQGQRQVRWVLPADAALVVEEPGLTALLRQFVEAGTAPKKMKSRSQRTA